MTAEVNTYDFSRYDGTGGVTVVGYPDISVAPHHFVQRTDPATLLETVEASLMPDEATTAVEKPASIIPAGTVPHG